MQTGEVKMRLNPEIYREAAKYVTEEEFACHALTHKLKVKPDYLNAFEELMGPSTLEDLYYSIDYAWLSEYKNPEERSIGEDFAAGTFEGNLRRELALLFMAEALEEN